VELPVSLLPFPNAGSNRSQHGLNSLQLTGARFAFCSEQASAGFWTAAALLGDAERIWLLTT
jgi:hypothetical protein